LPPGKHEALQVAGNALFILNLLLDIFDGGGREGIDIDCLACQSLDG